MKYLIPFLTLAVLTPSAYADNIASCEVILMEKIEDSELKGSAEVASYRPAGDFIASIYDDEDGHLTDIDGIAIRGVMCERQTIVPTETDYPIIITGIPLSLSQNFDSNTSGLITVYYQDDEFKYQYGGPDLTADEQALLDKRMAALNELPHNLVSPAAQEEDNADIVIEDEVESDTVEYEENSTKVDTIEQETTPEIVTLDPPAPETKSIADDNVYYQEFKVELKPKAEELGIPKEVVINLVKTNLGFVEVQKMLIDGGKIIQLLRAPEALKDYTDLLRSQILYNKKGDELPLVEVVDFILIDPTYFTKIPSE